MRTHARYLGVVVAVAALVFAVAGSASAHSLATPTISSFSPSQAMHGQQVTLYGSGFTGTTEVQFGGIDAQFTVVSDTHIKAIVPGEIGAGKWTINVLTKNGSTGSSVMFNVLPGGGVVLHSSKWMPRITSLSRLRGHVGSYIVIHGVNLNGALWVKLGGVKLPFTVPSTTQVNTVVSTKARSGKLTLKTNYGLATSPARFTILPGAVLAARH
jgi:hypothetical protein